MDVPTMFTIAVFHGWSALSVRRSLQAAAAQAQQQAQQQQQQQAQNPFSGFGAFANMRQQQQQRQQQGGMSKKSPYAQQDGPIIDAEWTTIDEGDK